MLLAFVLFAHVETASVRPAPQCSEIGRSVARRMRDLPSGVQTAVPYRMADPTEPFHVTDVVGPGEANWPWARLICGYPTPSGYVIEREQGGRGYNIGRLVLRSTPTGFVAEQRR